MRSIDKKEGSSMGYGESGYFETIQRICLNYLSKNYDLCYLTAMHHKNHDLGADTIIVGSSHSMNGIIESELISAGDVIQFSISSQDLYYDFEHIKKAVQEQKKPITRCLINLGYYMLYQDLSLSKLVRVIIPSVYLNLFGEYKCHNWPEAKMEDPFSSIDYDKDMYPERLIRGLCEFWSDKVILEQSSYYGDLLARENNNMLGVKKVQWESLSEEDRRTYAENRVLNGHNKHIEHVHTREENGVLLSDMVKFLADNDIKTYFFITPYTDEYMRFIDSRYKEDIVNALSDLPYPVEFFDMNDLSQEFDDGDFIDSDHLNLRGAHKATALLNAFISMVENE